MSFETTIERVKCLEQRKEIVHTIIHRMNLWQFIFLGGSWRKDYDEICRELSELSKKGT